MKRSTKKLIVVSFVVLPILNVFITLLSYFLIDKYFDNVMKEWCTYACGDTFFNEIFLTSFLIPQILLVIVFWCKKFIDA